VRALTRNGKQPLAVSQGRGGARGCCRVTDRRQTIRSRTDERMS
jgi:hypothetical protein